MSARSCSTAKRRQNRGPIPAQCNGTKGATAGLTTWLLTCSIVAACVPVERERDASAPDAAQRERDAGANVLDGGPVDASGADVRDAADDRDAATDPREDDGGLAWDAGGARQDGGVDGGEARDANVVDDGGGSSSNDAAVDAGPPCVRPDAGPLESTTPSFFSTLDDIDATRSPVYGAAGFFDPVSTTPAHDFVPGYLCAGVRIDEPTDWLGFARKQGPVVNYNTARGTLDLWWQPLWDHTDGIDHLLFTSGSAGSGFQIWKRGAADDNSLAITVRDDQGGDGGTTAVASADYILSSGVWTRLRVTWDFTVGAGERNVRIYLDGVELPASYGTPATGPVSTDPAGPNETLLFGRWVGEPATGYVVDEIRLYDEPIAP